MRANNPAVYLHGLLFVEFVLAILSVVNLVSLLDWRGAPVDYSLFLQVKVSRLILGPEVLDVELESSKFDGIASCQPVVVKEGVFILVCPVAILLLGL